MPTTNNPFGVGTGRSSSVVPGYQLPSNVKITTIIEKSPSFRSNAERTFTNNDE